MGLLVSNCNDPCSCSNTGRAAQFINPDSQSGDYVLKMTWLLANPFNTMPPPPRVYLLIDDRINGGAYVQPGVVAIRTQRHQDGFLVYPSSVTISISYDVNGGVIYAASGNGRSLQGVTDPSYWALDLPGFVPSVAYPGRHEFISNVYPMRAPGDVLTMNASFTTDYTTGNVISDAIYQVDPYNISAPPVPPWAIAS